MAPKIAVVPASQLNPSNLTAQAYVEPTIKLIKDRSWTGGSGAVHRHREFRIEGGVLDPEWAKAARVPTPWCVFSVWGDGPHLGAYCGEVWPMAWPELFRPTDPNRAHVSPSVSLTEKGLAAIAAATEKGVVKP